MKNLIIIEGCDCTFKTTLVNEIKKNLDKDFMTFHFSKPNDITDVYGGYIDSLYELSKYNNVILDRSFLGEYVYSQLWRGGLSMTYDNFKHLLLRCQKFFDNVFIIFCTGNKKDIIERMKKRGEDLLKENEIEKCLFLFDDIKSITREIIFNANRMFNNSQLVLEYNSSEENKKSFINDFCDRFEELNISLGANNFYGEE